MLDLATSSLRYRDVIAASPAGHGETDQVASSSRDEFTGSFLSRLWFNCSIHVGVWCVFFCCVPIILYMILRAIFKFKKTDSFACFERHIQECTSKSSGFAGVDFPGLVLLCVQVSFCIACKYTGVWLERSVCWHISYTQLCFSFLFFNVISAVVLPLTSHPTLYSPMPTSVLHSVLSVSSPITGSPTLERHSLFLPTCLVFSTYFSLKMTSPPNNFVLIS